MSINKEPYKIEVWQEELIQSYTEYVSIEDENIRKTEEEYSSLTSEEKLKYIPHKIIDHYEETYGITIGSNDFSSPYQATNPIFRKNVNGSRDLTFTMYYRLFDEDSGEYEENPFISMLGNEAKIKLFFRNKWYDFIIKNRVEDSSNYTFTYTCKELYVNELSKNGFKTELDEKLENNQGTAAELAETILLDSDWEVDVENSDLLYETKTEPLYIGTLAQNITVKKLTDYRPDEDLDEEFTGINLSQNLAIPKGTRIMIFYSEVVDNKKNPVILYRPDQPQNFDEEIDDTSPEETKISPYEVDANSDIIINALNFEVQEEVSYSDSEVKTNIPSIFEGNLDVFPYRGVKVVKSQESGYDPYMDKFITKWKKEGDSTDSTEYYGYEHTEILRTDLAQNYLSNSDNFVNSDSGWVFDGTPAKGSKVNGKEKIVGYTGQVFELNNETDNNEQDSVLVLQLTNEEENYLYRDNQGEFYQVEVVEEGETIKKLIEVTSAEGEAYEDNVRAAVYQRRDNDEEGFNDKTDEQLEAMINDVLLGSRYSTRARYAINTGVAANRKQIENLTAGEEFLFAVSVGKFKENEQAPVYDNNDNKIEIKYGAKTPQDFYEFNDATEHDVFIKKAYDSASNEVDQALLGDNPYKYYLDNPDYAATYYETYNNHLKEKEDQYEKRYLTKLFKNGNKKVRSNWDGGGKKFRDEIMLNYLRIGADNQKTFDYTTVIYNAEEQKYETKVLGTGIVFCQQVAKNLLENKRKSELFNSEEDKISVARAIYDTLISGSFVAKNGETYYYGLYPSMALAAVNDAREIQKTKLLDYLWEPMGYDKAYYPAFDEIVEDIANFNNSFNEALFSQFYCALRDAYTTITGNALGWNFSDKEEAVLAAEISSMFKSIYKAAYDDTSIFDNYNKAKEYKKPDGAYYLMNLASWKIEATNKAQSAVLALEERDEHKLFQEPTEIVKQKQFLLNLKNATTQDITAIKEAEEALEALLNTYDIVSFYKDFGKFLIDKERDFKINYIPTEVGTEGYNQAYKSQLMGWIEEFKDEYPTDKEYNPGKYYLYEIAIPFMKYWVSEQEISTYVMKEDLYEVISEETSDTPTHYAVKTSFNPYIGGGEEQEAGGYVYDKNNNQIRLFDPEIDMPPVTFIPIKDDDGDYVYDVYKQHYRPFRAWDSQTFCNPVTLELDSELGVPGDIIHHGIKFFDGHLGSWDEMPTRYRMKRMREDPTSDKYKYLQKEETWTEQGHYKGKNYEYKVTYPAGYQYDTYVEDPRGMFINNADVSKSRLTKIKLFSGFIADNAEVYGFEITNDNGNVTKDTAIYKEADTPLTEEETKNKKGFFGRLIDRIKGSIKDSDNDQKELEPAQNKEGSVSGLDIINADSSIVTTDHYIEDDAALTLTIKDTEKNLGLFCARVSNNNPTEMEELLREGKLKEIKESSEEVLAVTEEETGTKTETTTPTVFIKYKGWYWRHWGKKRYSYQPKICSMRNINGVIIYKPFNNIEDAISDDYTVISVEKYNTAETKPEIAYSLRADYKSYRQASEYDNGAYKYVMRPASKLDKNYWVLSPDGQNYMRKYKWGDGEIRLFDGHIGKWIQCYSAEMVSADTTISQTEIDNGTLPEFYIPYNNVMVPYDERIFANRKRYTRQRLGRDDNRFVLSNNEYIPLYKYWELNGYTTVLDYKGLKISFIDNYEYDAANFAIKDIPENRNKYLSFNLDVEPNGYKDLLVSEDPLTEEKTYERWYYWKSMVTKGFSLTDDMLSRIGILFETTKSSSEQSLSSTQNETVTKSLHKYPFLGMQLFRYIPYEKKLPEIEETKIEDEENAINSVIEAYNNLYGSTEDTDSSNPLELSKDNSVSLATILQRIGEDSSINKPNLFINTLITEKVLKDHSKKLFWKTKEIGKNSVTIPELIATEEGYMVVPLFPGEAPDAKDLIRTKYFIYDSSKNYNENNIIYSYVGIKPELVFSPIYDNDCQKIRSIKGKESNYFNLIQNICETFDCWVDVIVDHDDCGRVVYEEEPIYIQQNQEPNEEPQIYVGALSKKKKVDDRIDVLIGQLQTDLTDGTINIVKDPLNETYYIFSETVKFDNYNQKEIDEFELKLKELNKLIKFNNNHSIEYIKVPKKQIRFKRYVGQENWNGFKYGVNLNHIKRTVDSSQISTRVIVKANNNEYGKDGFCTIQRAEENPIKENFLLDFSYYTQLGMLDKHQLTNDLYVRGGTKINYYNRLAKLNKDLDKNAEELSSLTISLDNITAKYETAVLARDAAQEEITKLAQILSTNYDEYGTIMDSPWSFNKSQEYEIRKQTSTPGKDDVSLQIQGAEVDPYNVKVHLPPTATAVEYPKYGSSVQTYLDQMDVYQKEYLNNQTLVNKLKAEKEGIEEKIKAILEVEQEIIDKKNELNKLFFYKYARYIQEGSWIDEKYIDDNLYYLDGLSVLRTSCKPKITYDIGVIDISAAIGYEEDRAVLQNEIGDRTYIEDTEFFGWVGEPNNSRPYWEEVVISEITYSLDDPSANKIQVKNYSTQFDDLFKRITATSQQLQFNEGAYSKVAAIVNTDGTINKDVLQESIVNADLLLTSSTNEDVYWDQSGITITNKLNDSNILRLVSGGILLSTDGGNSFITAITGRGINADLLLTGTLNTEKLVIGSKSYPNFLWNGLGISAFKKERGIDYSTFVRYDQYGIYGIKEYSSNGKAPSSMSINDSFAPKSIKDITNNEHLVFGLTWDGFILNTGDQDNRGRVTIGTNQDFKMSEFSYPENKWKDRLLIGKMKNDKNEEYYGFRINNNDGIAVMETGDNGELYLRQKLRIDNFGTVRNANTFEKVTYIEEDGSQTYYYITYLEDGTVKFYSESYIEITDTDLLQKLRDTFPWKINSPASYDRVTLGIVDTYSKSLDENTGKTIFTKIKLNGRYSSTDYLTKVMSVKANDYTSNQQFTAQQISQLIDKNENFAIFDNGNLYAKNAWIEGNIRATSGNILGQLVIGEKGDSYGSIIHADGSWAINGDGTATFNNVNISGTISTAVFEYDKVQTIAGIMGVFPAFVVYDVEIIEDQILVYLNMSEIPTELQVGNLYAVFSDFQNFANQNNPIKINSFDTKILADNNQYVVLYFDFSDDLKNIIKKDIPVFISNQSTLESFSEQYGIIINATDKSDYPKHSLSIVDLGKPKKRPTLVLGQLTSDLFKNQDIANRFDGTYGLYSDNVYLHGTIVSESENSVAGITTDNLISYTSNSDDQIVFFAGKGYSEQDLSFYVTKYGRLYAKDGYFSGIIEASEIKGGGNDPGLIFRDLTKAIRFVTTGTEKDKVHFELTNNNAIFYSYPSSEKSNLLDINMMANHIALFNSTLKIQQDTEEVSFVYNNQKLLRFTKEKDSYKAILNDGGSNTIGSNGYFEDASEGCNIIII